MKQWVQNDVMSDKKSCWWQRLMVHLRDPYHRQYPLTFWLIAWMMGQSTSSASPQAIQRCEQVNVLPVRGGRLESWTKRCLREFNSEKCGGAAFWGGIIPATGQLQNDGLGSTFADQKLSILLDTRWKTASNVFSWQRGLIVFGLHLKVSSAGCDSALCSALIWTSGYSTVLLCTKDTDLLEEVTKMLEAQERIVT